MTIAAGFVVKDGILLCADTLYTDGFTKEYREKIFPWIGQDESVCFAIAGHALIGRMAVEDCRQALWGSKRPHHTIAQIMATIRPLLKAVYEQYVDTRPQHEQQTADFSLLIAVATTGERPRLFSTYHGATAPIDSFECLGIGRHLGRYVIEPMFNPGMTIGEAAVLGIHALGAAKERVDGVGGKSQFVSMRGTAISPIVPHDIDLSEQLILTFRKLTGDLLLAVSNSELDAVRFRRHFEEFVFQVENMRTVWLDRAAPLNALMRSLAEIGTFPPEGL